MIPVIGQNSGEKYDKNSKCCRCSQIVTQCSVSWTFGMVTFAVCRTRPGMCFKIHYSSLYVKDHYLTTMSKRPIFILLAVGISLRNITITGLAESLIFGHVGSRGDSVFTLAIFYGENT